MSDSSSVDSGYGMPYRLVFVRHGESEANVIQKAEKAARAAGETFDFPEGLRKTPDREIRLSSKGRDQAGLTGPWLGSVYPDGFDHIYVSDHTRAKETAAIVCEGAGWTDARIRIDPLLGERNWGRFSEISEELRKEIFELRKRDPLHTPMPHGETLLETRDRSRQLLSRAAREFGRKQILIFSHGEYIESIWAEIAHMHTEMQLEYFHPPNNDHSAHPGGDIRNCQVVEFSSTDPSTGEYVRKLRWVRSSCPNVGVYGEWLRLKRREFTPAQLRSQVDRYPHLPFTAD